ncbi:MAG: M14 family zinc carboxypeptidase [Anaerolineaceae bacterium]|nr:M14 family zinc carboxypeptidase [Anaerolineaceae bacterium]
MTKKSVLFSLLLSLGVVIFSSFSTIQAEYQPQTAIPDFPCYRDSASISQSLQNLISEYPGLVQLSTIGNSWEGKPIQFLKITNQSIDTYKPRLILISGLRGNAFAPVELSVRFAEQLLANYDEKTDSAWMVDHFELHLILLSNPDGRAKAEDQALAGADITWQNNTNNACSNQDIGVRLNHNFPYDWLASETGPCDPAYSGSSAASEIETQAIMTYLENLANQPGPILLLHLDSYQNEILSPFLSNPTAENPHLNDLYTLAEKIAYNTLSVPIPQGDPGHQPSYGTLIDYAYGTLDIPSLAFSMGDEYAGGYTSFCWYFDEILVENNITALYRALNISADPYHQAYGPDIEIENVNHTISSITIQGSADDYSTWHDGADVYSEVKNVQFSIDLPPWHPDATLFPIIDLMRDSQSDWISQFTLDIDCSSISPGYHRIFFQAWDTEDNGNPSNPGLVSVVEIFIPYQQFLPIMIAE